MSNPVASSAWKKVARPFLAISLACTALVGLQGCVAVVVGSAVVGTLAATDRRTLGAQTEDKAIVLKGESALRRALGDAAHVNVNSFNRRALITGEVADEQARLTAENEVRAIQGVAAVQNEVIVSGLSNFSARSSDAVITTKVKASLFDTKDLYGNAFKVITEGGTVFLMGRVTQREGDLAARVAAGVNGVRKVVKVFEYITEAELKAMLATPGKIDLSEESK
ncbi:BON domain-containing protein [Undibacterium fentianense]|uniref:BON domain-containing protein n=1 Tax=Undibacterium fentianense TaxID=2828728 RepID=A0A941IGM8_9BURK|nr:BON domain-containing protein [Undibacterium fentianense]MBR7801512.1 BON domain-containing protein [Undibacterium fentianense]